LYAFFIGITMIWRLKYIILTCGVILVGWLSYSFYYYFATSAQPTCTMNGLEENKAYAGDIHCTIHAQHPYRVSDISLWLDNRPILERFKINRSYCDHSFTLASTTLPDGPHNLKIQLTDGSYRRNIASQEIPFIVDNIILQAALVKPTGECKVLQGRTLHVQFQVNKEIKEAKINVLSRTYPCFAESPGSTIYECFVPIACEEIPNEFLYTIHITDQVGNHLSLENKFQVIAFPFKKQTLTMRSKTPEQDNYISAQAKEFEEKLAELIKQSPAKKLWRAPFCIPVEMTSITTDFGTIRTTQEKGRYAHKALDLIAPPKSVVWAPADGIVVHIHDYEHNSGKTVVIDHGHSLISIFFHLDNFASHLREGDKIKRGQPIGTVGKSGYANGYHLHWGMSIDGIEIEPIQWTKMNF